jgi:cardiolipin synthase
MTKTNFANITIVVTGLAWMGHGIRSIDSTIEEMLTEASDEIQVATYTITKGAKGFIQLLSDCLNRGVRVTLILNRFGEQPRETQTAVAQLARQFPHFRLFEFNPEDKMEDLHAKLVVVDRSIALVGSSNLSWKGLTLNHELALLIKGPAAAKVGNLIDILGKDTRTTSVML